MSRISGTFLGNSLDRLPPRLRLIAGLVPEGRAMADVGTDHGLLPIALVGSGRSPRAIATDLNEGPLRSAREQIRSAGLESRIETRRGDGLSALSPGEAPVIVIAGMGGATAAGILERGRQVAAASERLILQPMNAGGRLRRWLVSNGFRLIDEEIVRDSHRLYVIIVSGPVADGDTDAAPNSGDIGSEDGLLADVGPILWRKRHQLFPELVSEELARLTRIQNKMERRISSDRPRLEDIRRRIARLEVLCDCWPR